MAIATRSRESRPVPKLIAEAGLPRWTYETTLRNEGLLQLGEIVTTSGHVLSDGLRHFSLTCGEDGAARMIAARAVAMFAKVIAASGTPTLYVPLGDLAREVRQLDYNREDDIALSPVIERRGRGFLCVPDFGATEAYASPSEMHDCLSFLMQHARRGGGLVIGGLNAKAPYPVTTFGPAFAAFAADFTNLKVA